MPADFQGPFAFYLVLPAESDIMDVTGHGHAGHLARQEEWYFNDEQA